MAYRRRIDGSRLGSTLLDAQTVDDTPLRIRGRVGTGLYRAARAAGAGPSTVQAYLKALAGRVEHA